MEGWFAQLSGSRGVQAQLRTTAAWARSSPRGGLVVLIAAQSWDYTYDAWVGARHHHRVPVADFPTGDAPPMNRLVCAQP